MTLVIAYCPDVNRRNLLTPTVGENPMFQSFREEYLGFLSPEDSEAMMREIGGWKQIKCILLPMKTAAPGTEYIVADNQGGQP